MSLFKPCSSDLFFKSTKEGDPRLGELTQTSKGEKSFTLAGYPDDDGIQLNGGRLGARQAPDVIRKYFYKLTPSPWKKTSFNFQDMGNLSTEIALAERHESLKKEIERSLNSPNTCWIGLGGGHDYGYPDGAGFLLSQKQSKRKPLVINFDAHLDVRPTTQGLSSGTPFYRLLTDNSLPDFDFIEIGIQAHCNSTPHYDWLKERGALIIDMEEILINGFQATCMEKLIPYMIKSRPTFLSIDIDAFSSAYAPGCSQSWATGLVPNEFMPLLKILKKRLDVKMLSIYEVSPPLDIDDHTSKLAAQILHSFIY